MKLLMPLTGTLVTLNPISGDPDDPVRPIGIDLGNVSWTILEVDLENEVMLIEGESGETVEESTAEVDSEGTPIYKRRPATDEEKLGFLQYAQRLIMEHTKDELYQMSGCHRLKRPFKERLT